VLEDRRRKALSEIRRKAKVYTPIREELIALRRAIAEDRHLQFGVLRDRDDPMAQTMGGPPVLAIWRELVEAGRANNAASPRVRDALNHVEACTDAFYPAAREAQTTFRERSNAIAQQSGFSPPVSNWYGTSFGSVLRLGLLGSDVLGDPFTDALTAEQSRFLELWEADADVREETTAVEEAERALRDAVPLAITELDAAMKRVAEKYEHEPD
jgi:hypothetical protein